MKYLLTLALLATFTLTAAAQPPDKGGPPGKGQRGSFEKGGQEKGPPGAGRGMRPGGPGFELGRILPPPMRQMLELSQEQIQQLDQLEKEVKDKLNKLLTDDQKKQLENIRTRGPGGPGSPGGPPDGGNFNRKDGPGKGKDTGNRPPPPDKDRN